MCSLLCVDDNDPIVNQILDGILESKAFVRRVCAGSMILAKHARLIPRRKRIRWWTNLRELQERRNLGKDSV